MNDAVWTAEATEKAVALWIEGRDPAEIAGVIGTSVTDVIGRVAQAALARQQAKAEARNEAAAQAKPRRLPSLRLPSRRLPGRKPRHRPSPP